MLVAYLDDSGSDGDSEVVVMAGYVATEEGWSRFNNEVEPIFSSRNIETFHTKDLFSTRGAFKGWKVEQKFELLDAAYSCLARERPLGAAFAVNKATYRASKQRDDVNHQISAYAMCFNAIIDILIKHERIGPAIRADGLKFVVESGNKNDADLARMFGALGAKYPEFSTYFRELQFSPKDSCRAIQIADALAFLFRRHAVEVYKNSAARYPLLLDRVIRRVEHYGIVSTNFYKDGPEVEAEESSGQ